MIALVLAAAATTALSAVHYDCTIDKQFVVNNQGGSWNNSQVKFPGVAGGDWKFAVDLNGSDDLTAKVAWAKDPIQIAGEHAALRIGQGSVAFVAVAGAPCMFTEQSCMSMVEIVDASDGTAVVSITPAGMSKDEQSEARTLLQVTSLGTCKRSEGKIQ